MAIGNALENLKLDEERNNLEASIADYQWQYQQLSGIRDYLRSDEYVQSIARRELGLVMPGEPAVIVVSPKAAATPPADRSGQHWWERLIKD